MFDNDDLISDAFDDFAKAAGPSVRPTGAESVRTTVKHRRTVRAMTLSVLAALVVVTPVAAYAMTARGGQSPPTNPASAPVAVTSTTPGPTASAPSTAPTSPPPSVTPTGPDGRISVSQLVSAGKLTIPKWTASQLGCPTGKQKLVKGTTINHDSNQVGLQIYKVVYTNLDNDSSLETAALISCQYGEAAEDQVVAFDRDSSGHVVTLGRIAEGHIWSVTAKASGGVTIDISDSQSCCSTPKQMEDHQQRSYAWNGSAFVQTSGPTTFYAPSKPNKIAVVVTSATWSAPHNNERTATLKLKITNNSSYDSNSLLVMTDPDSSQSTFKILSEPGVRAGHSETVTVVVQWTDLNCGIQTAQDTAAGFVTSCDNSLTVYEMGSDTVWPANKPYGVIVKFPLWS